MKIDSKISIICMTYNHEKYISKALEGFIMQKTSVPYEVIIHDDASTDRTPDIIKKYEYKYSNIITTIIQKENKYSKGINVLEQYILPLVHGKYIAVCEGDDYWIDSYKLQKQYDALESHPEIDMCAHGAYVSYFNSDKLSSTISPAKDNKILTAEDVIKGGGGFLATASLMYRRELNVPIPSFRNILDIDYMLQIQGALKGGIYYISDYMSVYRSGSVNSWTEKYNSNMNYRIAFNDRLIAALKELDKFSNGKYSDVINNVCFEKQVENICSLREFNKLKSGDMNKRYCALGIKVKIKIALKKYFPFLDKISYRVKKLVYQRHEK